MATLPAQSREGGAGHYQRRRAELAAAQSAPEPSPGGREHRRARAGAGVWASEPRGGGPEKAVDRSAYRARTPAVSVSSRRIPVSTGGRVSASRQAWWLHWSLSPDPGCAHPAAPSQAHRWLRGGRGCPRPRKELANSVPGRDFRAPVSPSPTALASGFGWRARRGALPFPTHPQRIQRDAGRAPPQATSQILAH